MIKNNPSKWAIRPLVPEEVYTDRQEHIDYLYNSGSGEPAGQKSHSSLQPWRMFGSAPAMDLCP